jgi:hypothetical protein
MNEQDAVFVVRGQRQRWRDAWEIVYEHVFASRQEAMVIHRMGETQLPAIYWTVERMAYGHMEFAVWRFDQLVKEMTEGVE